MANLLIVEDDADEAELLVAVLRTGGHEVRVARDGQDGLRLAAERVPDLVLLDVELPGLSGPEMAARLRQGNHGAEKIPVVLVSGVADLALVAARVGTPYFIPKPFTVDGVLRLVGRILDERRPPGPGGGR